MEVQGMDKTVTEAQHRLIRKLQNGYMIYEEKAKSPESVSYITARLTGDYPAFMYPRHVNNRTVFALLAEGLLEEFRPWPLYEAVALRLNEARLAEMMEVC